MLETHLSPPVGQFGSRNIRYLDAASGCVQIGRANEFDRRKVMAYVRQDVENIRHEMAEEKTAATEIGAGSTVEGLSGVAAIVLGIIGLIGILPLELASVASIALGAGILVQGGMLGARYTTFVNHPHSSYTDDTVLGGAALEVLAGIAGIVLGILALLGILPITLLAVSAIALGGTLLLSGSSMAAMNSAKSRAPIEAVNESGLTAYTLYAASGLDVLAGAGAVVLGILALSGYFPLTLVLIALLGIGAFVLLSGTSLAMRFFGIFAR